MIWSCRTVLAYTLQNIRTATSNPVFHKNFLFLHPTFKTRWGAYVGGPPLANDGFCRWINPITHKEDPLQTKSIGRSLLSYLAIRETAFIVFQLPSLRHFNSNLTSVNSARPEFNNENWQRASPCPLPLTPCCPFLIVQLRFFFYKHSIYSGPLMKTCKCIQT